MQPPEAPTVSRTLLIDAPRSPEPFARINIIASNAYCNPAEAAKASVRVKQMPDQQAAYQTFAAQTRMMNLYAQDPHHWRPATLIDQ